MNSKQKQQEQPRQRGKRRTFYILLQTALISLIYYGLVYINNHWLMMPRGVPAIWVPGGFALAMFLLSDKRNRVFILTGIYIANTLGIREWAGSLSVAALLSVSACLQVLLAAWFIDKIFKKKYALESFYHIMMLLLGSALTTIAITVPGAALQAFIFNADYLKLIQVWGIATFTGNVVITPMIIAWAASPLKLLSLPRERFIEAAILYIVYLSSLWYAFIVVDGMSSFWVSVEFLIPCILWSAVRLGRRGASLTILIMLAFFIPSTLQGRGFMPLFNIPLWQLMLMAQTFLGIFSVFSIALASLLNQHTEIESSLREGETRFRTLIENAPVAIEIVRRGVIIYANQTYAQMFAYQDEDECLGQSILDNFASQIREEVSNHIYRHDNSLVAINEYETTGQRKDGSQFPMFVAITHVNLPDGFASVIFFTDISEHKKAEEILYESERKHRQLVETLQEGIWAVDKDSITTYVNPQMALMLGYSIEEMIGETIHSFIDPQKRDALYAKMGNTHREMKGRYDFEFIKKDNSPLQVNIGVSPILDKQGKFDGALTGIIDISERLQREEETRQRNEELETIQFILSVIITQLDLKVILNRSLESAVGLTDMEGGVVCLTDFNRQLLSLSASLNITSVISQGLYEQTISIYNSLLGTSNRTSKSIIAWNDADLGTNKMPDAMKNQGVQFYASFPLQTKDRIIGILCVFSRSQKSPNQNRLRLLANLCGPVALAIENAQLYEEKYLEAARSEALARIAAHLNSQLDINQLLRSVCEETTTIMGVPAASIFLYDESNDALSFSLGIGLPSTFGKRVKPFPRSVLAKYVQGNTVFISDIQSLSDAPNLRLFNSLKIRSIGGVAMIHKGMVIGALLIFTYKQERLYSEDEITLLKGLASLAAQALNNASLFNQLSSSREHLRTVSKKLVEVQEAERRSLALELHDELGQILNSVKLSLDMIPLLPEEGAQKQYQRASMLVSDLVGRVRRMALELRPSMLDDMGLLPALLWLFRFYQTQTNEVVEFNHTGMEQRFSPEVEITAYRIVQEALTNAIRHAKNKKIAVSIWTDQEFLNFRILDQGGGFDIRKVNSTNASSGLSGMRERARLIGGELIIESVPGEGTSLTASLPLVQPISTGE